MNDVKRAFVSIYCKIYTDTFSNEMLDKKATGKEIFEFLMKDAQHCYDDSGQLISGDCNLWYLGCNEKFGELVLEDKVWKWSFGESSFENVRAFVSMLCEKHLILKQQYQALMDKIAEGRLIDNMYLIKDYLICKKEGRSSDFIMPDVMKIGGVTGWLRAAALAQTHNIRLSNHLWPEISAQLLCLTPTAHWLEYADWWNPIMAEPLQIEKGMAMVDNATGTGVSWNEDVVAQFII